MNIEPANFAEPPDDGSDLIAMRSEEAALWSLRSGQTETLKATTQREKDWMEDELEALRADLAGEWDVVVVVEEPEV